MTKNEMINRTKNQPKDIEDLKQLWIAKIGKYFAKAEQEKEWHNFCSKCRAEGKSVTSVFWILFWE